MRSFDRWSWTAALVLMTLGCAAEEGAAQDEPPTQQAPKPQGAAKDEADDDAPQVTFTATVKDRYLQDPWQVKNAVLFVPEVSLFGGGGGKETRSLLVKRGAAELDIPLERIAKLEIGEQDEDLLSVKVLLRPAEGEPTPAPIEGTVRSSLELRGTFNTSDLKTTVRLREAAWIELAVQK